MNRAWKILTFSLVLILLVACSSKGKVLTFQGEGENWKASYEAGESSTIYTIVYIGNEEVPTTLDYSVSPIFGGSNTEVTGASLNDQGFIQQTKQTIGNVKVQEDESINVEINWNGKTEKLNLTLK